MKIIIPGKPIAKKRPRFARRGKFTTTYSDQETEEGKVLWEIRQQVKGKPLEGAVKVHMIFDMYIPKSTSLKRKKLMLENRIMHIKRPDIDNLTKWIYDIFNGVVWRDDSLVIEEHAIKKYSENPKTTVIVEVING